MEKIDFKKELQHLYRPSTKSVEIVDVPQLNFLMVDGMGDPNSSQTFKEAVEALFSLSYTLKFMIKKGPLAIDYGVLPLEGLWWADDMSAFATGNKEVWQWTLMVMQPDFVSAELVTAASAEVRKKKNPPALAKVRFEAFAEGRCAQLMHIGPFTEEGPTVARVHTFIEQQGGQLTGKHHEIYLSDLRRTAPEKWKTIVRQPMA